MKNAISLLSVVLITAACSAKPEPSTPSDATGAGAPSDVECTLGDTRPADDGCNTCTCTEQGWACTELGCVDPMAEEAPAEDGG